MDVHLQICYFMAFHHPHSIISISSPYLADMAMISPHLSHFLQPRRRSLDAQVQLAGLEGRRTRHARHGARSALEEVGREAEGGASRLEGDAIFGGIPPKKTQILQYQYLYIYTPAAEEKMIWNQIKLWILWMVSISFQHPKISQIFQSANSTTSG